MSATELPTTDLPYSDDPASDEAIADADAVKRLIGDPVFKRVLERLEATYFATFRETRDPSHLMELHAKCAAIGDIRKAMQRTLADGEAARARRDRVVGRRR